MALNETDTRSKLIDPALFRRGWTEANIKREETAGAIDIVGGKPRKRGRGRMDYVLRLPAATGAEPVAVAIIEAKKESDLPGKGLEQAKAYQLADRFHVPFVFSSNGHLYVEFDRTSGLTSAPKPLSEFPRPEELQARYEAYLGFRLDSEAAKPLLVPYPSSGLARRYYQDAAIRATLEKIGRCRTEGKPGRALLTLATGAGKTFIAANLLKRLAEAEQLTKALFLCDRDELRTQAAADLQNMFGSNAAVVSAGQPQKNARILIATYQTLGVDEADGDASFLSQNYPDNYFSHIIIDECHRSAWGKWFEVLRRNDAAVQIGLTATPRQLDITPEAMAQLETERDQRILADNLQYFGEPVYTYDIAQGIEDGYLAACEIHRGQVNLDATGLTGEEVIARNPTDARTGQRVRDEDVRAAYGSGAFETQLMLPDRVRQMCADLFAQLLATGSPEQKTVIFCVRDSHADAVAAELNNLYAHWCREQEQSPAAHFAFKCTAESGGQDLLPDFRGSNRDYFVATTVDLLTTGVNVVSLRNVVFFKYVRSPIMFYQMVGRGTRLDPATEKLMFRVYDYTDATLQFGEAFISKLRGKESEANPDQDWYDLGDDDVEPPQIITVEGFDVEISGRGRFVLGTVNGQALPIPVAEYEAQLAQQLKSLAATVAEFRGYWVERQARAELLRELVEGGRSPKVVQLLREMQAYDLFDVLGQVGYDCDPQTRMLRVAMFVQNHRAWLGAMPVKSARTVEAIAEQFVRAGTDGLEDQQLFKVPEVLQAGGLPALKLVGKPVEVLQEMKIRLFAV